MYSTKVSDGQAAAAAADAKGRAPAKAAQDMSSWYGKLAKAWGTALDAQTDRTVAAARELTKGNDGPGQALQVQASAQQLTFLCTAASNVSNSIGQALETLGRKQ
jgi:hypothetical protein